MIPKKKDQLSMVKNNKNGKCKFHFFIDTPTWCYYCRDCLVCKKHIGLILNYLKYGNN